MRVSSLSRFRVSTLQQIDDEKSVPAVIRAMVQAGYLIDGFFCQGCSPATSYPNDLDWFDLLPKSVSAPERRDAD